MKSNINRFGLLLLTTTLVLVADKDTKNHAPSADAIVIVLKNGSFWSIKKLNEVALKFLEEKGSMKEWPESSPLVRLYPDDRTKMCEFIYKKGFDQPVWYVTIGYDGKVTDFKERVAREATFEAPTPSDAPK
ncbi:MAG TPA: hypothetical protein VN887_20465 [Candidatus Angelobacter sp.]|nr:hypothetical protein [Candidatus Angelobacter sp.]